MKLLKENKMIEKYMPETKFAIDDNLIYNLKQNGYRKGKPLMVNDMTISLGWTKGVDKELLADMAQTICDALNEKYCKDIGDTT